MKTNIKTFNAKSIALTLLIVIFAPSSVFAQETNRLKLVMNGLLKDTQLLNEGIFLEDYKKIELAAGNIADHPTPGKETMQKVMENLGTEMPTFKGYDMKVHNTAVIIAKAAKENDMKSIVSNYHQLIDGCLSCHNNYKKRVSNILSQD